MIAHHPKTIEHADQILVVNEGRIEKTVAHRNLFERKGLYAHCSPVQYAAACTSHNTAIAKKTRKQSKADFSFR